MHVHIYIIHAQIVILLSNIMFFHLLVCALMLRWSGHKQILYAHLLFHASRGRQTLSLHLVHSFFTIFPPLSLIFGQGLVFEPSVS